MADLEQRRHWLDQTVAEPHQVTKDNPYRYGPLHQAAVAAVDADLAYRAAHTTAGAPRLGLIDRRRTRRELEAAQAAVAPAQARLDQLVAVRDTWLAGRADRAARQHDRAAEALQKRNDWLAITRSPGAAWCASPTTWPTWTAWPKPNARPPSSTPKPTVWPGSDPPSPLSPPNGRGERFGPPRR